MATTADTNVNTATSRTIAETNHSPRHSTATENNNMSNSPKSHRATKVAASPWKTIVRGETETMAVTPSSSAASSSPAVIERAAASAPSSSTVVASAPSSSTVASASSSSSMEEEESPESGNGQNSNVGKRPAWNKPSNGVMEIGPVMGAVSWPALSESARVSTKVSSADGSSSVSVSQGTGTASLFSHEQVGNNPNLNSTPNNTIPARQRSMKRNGSNAFSNGGTTQPSSLQGLEGEVHLSNHSPRDHAQRSSQSRNANDHPQQQRNSFRNRNGGPHSRGDGSHHHNYGGRRDQDRANHEWNTHRNFNGRDAHVQPQRGVPRFMRHPPPPPPPPPPTSTPFIQPPPVRPFGNPMGYPDVYLVAAPPPESLRGMPFVAAPIPHHAMFFPAPDLQLHSKIVNQIDYYFSNDNLIKDTFLRQNMDEQGWVPIKLIAGFNKVLQLTDNIQLILDAVRSSAVVEVQGDKMRRRNDWMRWIMPPSVQFANLSSPQASRNSSHDVLAAHFQGISLEEKTSHARGRADTRTEMFLSGSSSGDSNSQSQLSGSEGMGQVGFDHSTSARN